MRVDHLYVLSMLASLDSDPDKNLETSRTAKPLYDRHGKKAKTPALVEISNSWRSKSDSNVLETSGDNVKRTPKTSTCPFWVMERGAGFLYTVILGRGEPAALTVAGVPPRERQAGSFEK